MEVHTLLLTALEQHYCCRSFVKFINDSRKRMGKQLGIIRKVATIVSRHSFSTQLNLGALTGTFAISSTLSNQIGTEQFTEATKEAVFT